MRRPRRPGHVLLRGFALGAACTLVAAACTTGGDAETPAADDAPVLHEGYVSEIYEDPAHWICHPDDDTDLCAGNLDATVIDAEGTLTVEEWEPAPDPAIDCFYVYPTISEDETPNSDLAWSEDEEGFATRNQAARLGGVCRVFTPAYRQVTRAALGNLLGGGDMDVAPAREIAYADVVDAWRHYLANDNDGRGVVLVGHSQGSGHLGRLIAEEVDTDESTRDRLVAALLAGWPPPAFSGGDAAGEFEHVPLCEEADEVGCVVTWSTFLASEPPTDASPFGQVASGPTMGACVNPVTPAGGAATSTAYFPSEAAAALGVPPDAIDTPFVAVTDVIEVECVSTADFNYLAATFHQGGAIADAVASDIGWGLHLIDVSIVMGDVVDLVETQAEAYPSRPERP